MHHNKKFDSLNTTDSLGLYLHRARLRKPLAPGGYSINLWVRVCPQQGIGYERGGDAFHLAQGCKSLILV